MPTETPAPRRKAWPMLAFITATGVVAWAVLHFTSHPMGMPKQNQAEPPAVEMMLPAPSVTAQTEQDRADDAFYKSQQGRDEDGRDVRSRQGRRFQRETPGRRA